MTVEAGAPQVTPAQIEARLALANWQKYNGEKSDEIVYQAEKVARALEGLLAALSSSTGDVGVGDG